MLEEAILLFDELGEAIGVCIVACLLERPGAASLAVEIDPVLLSRAWRGVFGREMPGQAVRSDSRADSLTPREREVLALRALHYGNREIASKLVLSVRTVERHIANIHAKTGLSSRRETAEYAHQLGLLAPE